jgi:tricorn protease
VTQTYLRFPHLHQDLLTFATDDDVWLAEIPVDGASSRAWRVTTDHAPVSRPRISPDSTRIAWTSTRDGAPEAYTVPIDGGATTRLTYWGHLRRGSSGGS